MYNLGVRQGNFGFLWQIESTCHKQDFSGYGCAAKAVVVRQPEGKSKDLELLLLIPSLLRLFESCLSSRRLLETIPLNN